MALKKLKVGGNLDDFLKEAKILSSLSHPCIVKVYGVCYELKIIVSIHLKENRARNFRNLIDFCLYFLKQGSRTGETRLVE